MDLESSSSVGGNHPASRSLNGRSFPQRWKLTTLWASPSRMPRSDESASIIRAKGSTHGAETDREVRFVLNRRLAL